MKKFILELLLISILTSCDEKRFKPDPSGKTGEIVVVMENRFTEKESGVAIKNVLGQFQHGLPQEEPLFTLIVIPEEAFGKILQRHRNVLITEISPEKKANIDLQEDIWANNQIYVKITAPNDSVFASLIYKNHKTLISYFKEKELHRLAVSMKRITDKNIQKQIIDKHGIELSIPKGFRILSDTTNFTWLQYELERSSGGNKHTVSKNLLIYHEEYTREEMLSPGGILDVQDSVTKVHVPGSVPGSFMKTVDIFPVSNESINLNGNYAMEIRGLWDLQGDFMGGPFLNYATIDTTQNKIISMVAFIYAPNFNKREYLRELEGIMRSYKLRKE